MRSAEATLSDAIHFGSDAEPGIRRRGTKRFTYVNELTGKPPSGDDMARIRSLVIPPAWTDVWISPSAASHLQATGRDAKGRKQYRYHDAFTATQAEAKFDDLVPFGNVLGALRRRVARDLSGVKRGVADLDHDRVVATVVRLLDLTSLRIGNPEYSRTNNSFGLTTLKNGHAVVRGSKIHLQFTGKSAHEFDVSVDNRRLAKIVRSCQHLPGQSLFEYRTPDGKVRSIGSNDVNSYLAEHAAAGVTAKTFRTWNGTVRAAEGFAAISDPDVTPTKRSINEVIDQVAGHLGNTRTVCRNSYIHPKVIESYISGDLGRGWNRPVSARPSGLTVGERRTLRLLRRR